ncbi:hypothetical protein [Sphingomonas sp.]|uniref:hypothetical protein n=1 Tax=Sphingomonas sp. TaxID=28214 RepID=UPI003CC5B713
MQTDDEGDAAALESVSTPPLAMSSAQLTVTLNPTRAGLNLLTATVEADVIVANTGDTAAVDIRAGVDLDSAGAGGSNKQAPVGVFPPARPVVPPFALAPGEERRFRAVAALPHDAIRPLSAAGRPMFVPLITVQLGWTDAAGAQGAAQAWAIGIERPGSAKLAPFWLDVAPRSYDNVAARLTP